MSGNGGGVVTKHLLSLACSHGVAVGPLLLAQPNNNVHEAAVVLRNGQGASARGNAGISHAAACRSGCLPRSCGPNGQPFGQHQAASQAARGTESQAREPSAGATGRTAVATPRVLPATSSPPALRATHLQALVGAALGLLLLVLEWRTAGQASAPQAGREGCTQAPGCDLLSRGRQTGATCLLCHLGRLSPDLAGARERAVDLPHVACVTGAASE